VTGIAGEREEIRKALSSLIEEGQEVLLLETVKYLLEKKDATAAALPDARKKEASTFNLPRAYQRWYSKALRAVEQLLPDRYAEFVSLYRAEKPPKALNVTTYTIAHYLADLSVSQGGTPVFDRFTVFRIQFDQQISMVRSAEDRLDTILADIKGTLEAGLFDNELSAADDLRKKKHLRAAGVIAGVVLERHLKRVAANHGATTRRKKTPTISDLNDLLKDARVYDVVLWRKIQRLGDIRNYAAHDKERDPTDEEIKELIEGVEQLVKTVF
jgi:hypothetical protein